MTMDLIGLYSLHCKAYPFPQDAFQGWQKSDHRKGGRIEAAFGIAAAGSWATQL